MAVGSIILASLAAAAAQKGAKAAGGWLAQKKFEASSEGKAQAAVLEEAARISKKTPGELMPGEAAQAKAITAALAHARAKKREALATGSGATPKSPVASGVAAVKAAEEGHREAELAADVASQVHSAGAKAAVARKAAAAATVLPLAKAEQTRMKEQGEDFGEAGATGALAGISATKKALKAGKKVDSDSVAALGKR